ncbi:MAG TPA: hypothetical protein VFX61_03500 [Micromonosporaceae bacterium]|nr:hypothetical protein [Micromonosporaceae bacterium]
MQPGYPGQDPYGQQPPHDPNAPQYQDPYAQPAQPYGQPVSPGQPVYGQQPHQDPYAQQPTSGQPSYEQQPYGQQYPDPYAQQQYQDPYAQQPTSGQPYPASAYPAAGYSAPGQAPQNTMGLVGMILGIAAIPLLCCFSLGIPLGIAAAVLGFLGKQKAEQGLATNRSQAMTGLICGAVAAGIGIILNVLALAMNFSTSVL